MTLLPAEIQALQKVLRNRLQRLSQEGPSMGDLREEFMEDASAAAYWQDLRGKALDDFRAKMEVLLGDAT